VVTPHVTKKNKSSISLVLFTYMAPMTSEMPPDRSWRKTIAHTQQGRNHVLSGGHPQRERQQGQHI